MPYKLAVIGDSNGNDQKIRALSWEIGREIANNNLTLLTGGCNGYPFAAAEGALHVNGKVIGISPARDINEHIDYYKFPTAERMEINCTGLGIPTRNHQLVRESDAIIIINGKIGTLNEFSLAFYYKKIIGVLLKSGGIIDLIPHIVLACDRGDDKERMVFYENPVNLVKHVVMMLNKTKKS